MLRFIFILFLSWSRLPADTGRISGRAVDSKGESLPNVSVQLRKMNDSSALLVRQTDSTGHFQFENLTTGSYYLHYSSVGYVPFDSRPVNIDSSQPQVAIGDQPLQIADRQLDVVTVKATKPLYQPRPDGLVVNVADNVLSKGSSALDILERSPGVVLNRRDNNILLNGKDGVQVMLNGRLLKMPLAQVVTLLNGMSGNDIEKIELLATPSASYDAEGSAGIINIVLKKGRRRGTNGSISLTGGYGWREKATAGINLAHNTGKISSYGSYTYSHDRSRAALDGAGSMDFAPLGGQMNNVFDAKYKTTQNDHNVNLGADLNLDKRTTAGASIIYSNGSAPGQDWSRGEYDLPDSTLVFEGNTVRRDRWKNITSSLYMEKEDGHGGKWNLGLDYLRYADKNGSNIISSFQDTKSGTAVSTDSLYSPNQRSVGNILIQVGIVKFDFARKLGKHLKWEAGVKGNLADSKSNSAVEAFVHDEWVASLGTVSNMRMKEAIGAAYTSFNLELNAATSLTAGLRYEYADTRTYDLNTGQRVVDRQQGVLFPNISLTRKLSGKSELQLGWSKRISRPSYNDLASFVAYSDPVAINTGNPLLRPTITNNLRLAYNYGNYFFSVTASHDDHPIERYQLTENADRNILIISPQNAEYLNSLTFQFNLPIRLTRWWNVTAGFVGGWRHIREEYTKYPFETTFFGYSANFTQTFTLPHSLTIEVSGFRNGGGYYGSSSMSGFQSINAGIKKELPRDHGTLQLSVTDIFSSLHYSGTHGYNTEEAFKNVNHWNYDPDSRFFPIFKLTYTRPFGIASGRARTRDNGAGDEKDRIRNN